MIKLAGVSARSTIFSGRVVLEDVNLEQSQGLLAVLGSEFDGTTLLLDILDGTRVPRRGSASVLDGTPAQARARIARVSALAPLPDALTVDEACALESELRASDSPRPPSERLATLGVGLLARRPVRTLTLGERRAVALAIALTSSAQVVLIEEPFVAIDPVAHPLVIDALRDRAATASVIVTTASPRDAMRIADRLGVLTRGKYAPVDPTHLGAGADAPASMRVVVAPSAGRAGASALASVLGASGAVTRLEVSAYAPTSGAMAIFVSGPSLAELCKEVTRAIASARVDVELIEPSMPDVAAIRAAAVSPS